MNVLAKLCCYVLLPHWVAAGSDDDRPAKRARTSTSHEGLPEMDTQWLEQKIDHSDLTNAGKWKQRYYINKTHYTGNGPVFLRIGGAEEIDVALIKYGPWVDYARRVKALLVCVEHRYYGKSRPFDDLRTENLIYLTVEQALADLGYFITRIRQLYSNYIPSTAKWIAFGGSCAGTLAARLKMKFPHLIHAAVASSAPLLEMVNFRGYYEYIKDQANKYLGVESTIKDAFRMIHKAINDGEIEELKEKFNMCSFLNENNWLKNEQLFFWMLARFLVHTLHFGDVFTNLLTRNSTSNSFNKVASIVRILVHRYHEQCLLVDYNTAVEQYKDPLWGAETKINLILFLAIGNRQKLYQRCTEFGLFQTSEQEDSLFGDEIKIEFYLRFCEDVFGNEFNLTLTEQGVERANIYYGGMDIKVSHVLFVNGVRNAWYQLAVSVTEETEDRIVINISNARAMEDLYPSVKASVERAQKMVFDKLKEWLLS